VKAVDLPLVPAEESGVVYLLLPGFNEENYQGIQHELYPQQDVLMVYFYESGFEEYDDSQGRVVPVALDDHDRQVVEDLRTLHVVDPESPQDRDEITARDRKKIQDAHESFRG
jgi:hypothetical protein